MRLLTKISLLSFLFLISSPSVADLSTPKEIIQQVKERGVNSVVAEIGERKKREEIADFITTGDSEWLEVAFQLTPSIHHDFSSQILNSLSFALINNPVEVLAMANKYQLSSAHNICNIPSTLTGINNKEKFVRDVSTSLKTAKKVANRKDEENIEWCQLELNKSYTTYL
ncbi:hypothetical protein [Xenorhabdus innexi]|uniref:Uncharacterized protein n=1 Tax=Xenorhabdus innexi TaxID=290109 RepID=A0A1N6MQ93_9GAMM|nr:hypothetical protein [Xenorhabdus innexi]PHM36102.1 hypothetical protein Xinn_01818 [Xenorhabdus innexi]SIP71015.1 conserved exported hypothetical protein [Xenorhabdus innexi]